LVRWIQVPEYHSISWTVQPHKKGINFGIFKHPGTRNGITPNLPTQDHVDEASVPPTPAVEDVPRPRRESVQGSQIVEKLQSIGMKSVAWTGKCEADKVSMGRYDVQQGESGTYGLVFDNTFSKQTSKNVTFVLITHPTNAPPKSGHHLHYSQASSNGRSSSVGNTPTIRSAHESTDSLSQSNAHRAVLEDPRPVSKHGRFLEVKGLEGTTFYTGVLSKKKRKKGQGFAKRYFSLDFTSSTLSYYRDRHSSALRGAVPLSLAAVGVNEKTREFSVDSGAEVWHLKALNRKDFDGWREALERASTTAASLPPTPAKSLNKARPVSAVPPDPREDDEWDQVQRLVSIVSGSRDAVRGLAKDTDPKSTAGLQTSGLGLNVPNNHSALPSPSNDASNPYFPDMDEQAADRRSFWKRKTSADRSPSTVFRRSVSGQLAVPSPTIASPTSPVTGNFSLLPRRPSTTQIPAMTTDVHERCLALLHDLDTVVAEFTALLSESKARRNPPLATSVSRLSMESVDEQEYFDADDGARAASQLLKIRRNTESEAGDAREEQHYDSDTSSEAGGLAGSVVFGAPKPETKGEFPSRPDSLPPLPLGPVVRRPTIQPPKQAPPSIIGFLRKNAGKDLSTVSMPVTANEPTSLLQRLAESMEYASLLDSAASIDTSPAERLMYVAAFAISYFANSRVKERAIRKPFNPMLGETFELVREDLGFRFVAEKVSHHPVRTACQAESLNNGGWCFTQSPQPIQKFWGKSVELNTEGRARVVLYASQERYSWNQATCFLRNVIAGEKYVEPVQTMTIQSETSHLRAIATFKAGGMFSGRSEDVSVQILDGDESLPLGLIGKWTEGLHRTDTDEVVWTVGSLVPDAPRVYGFTTFAAALNEVTDIERGHLPPTDSRLRPDQQALEGGEIDRAEALKARLEERQRSRRKVLEGHGRKWTPQFFERMVSPSSGSSPSSSSPGDNNAVEEGEEVWVLKKAASHAGEAEYWHRRANGDWKDVQEVFEL
jgi:hypothetical protein